MSSLFPIFSLSFTNTKTYMRSFRFSYLLLLLLSFSACTSTYRVEKSQTANVHLDSLISIAPSEKVERMIRPYREKVNNGLTEVLCLSSEPVFGGRPESPLTNYFADLTLEESNRLCADKYPNMRIDVSMINRGGLRIPLPKGEIKTMTMFEMMPFENEIVFLKLTGEVMLQFINHMASRGGEGVGGMRFGIMDGKAVQPEIAGKPIDPAKTYWLATSDYIANGGDGNEILSNSVERIDTGIKARDQFIQYFRRLGKEGKTVTAKNDGRIYDAK
jgi:2',3'-cyclic-nucleotide 2'-phosphodiesterase (5'-nucleotidase family)